MHSYDGKSCIFHFNSDLTGDIIIQNKIDESKIRIDAEDVLKFVAFEYILSNKINELEQMNYKDLLK